MKLAPLRARPRAKPKPAGRRRRPHAGVGLQPAPLRDPNTGAELRARPWSTAGILPKLEVGPVNDPLEHQADAIADRVMRMPAPTPAAPKPAETQEPALDEAAERDEEHTEAPAVAALAGAADPPGERGPAVQRECSTCTAEDDDLHRTVDTLVQRACSSCDAEDELQRSAEPQLQRACTTCDAEDDELHRMEDEDELQRACATCEDEDTLHRESAAGARGGRTSQQFTTQVRNLQRGGGRQLPGSARAFLEPRLGVDLGSVRVHADAQAGALAKRVGAKAFTLGQHVFFAPGQLRPQSQGGMRLLAHEVAHTLQSSGEAQAVRRSPPDEELDDDAASQEIADYIESLIQSTEDTSGGFMVRAERTRFRLLLMDMDIPADWDSVEAAVDRLREIAGDEFETLDELGPETHDEYTKDYPEAFPEWWAGEIELELLLVPPHDLASKHEASTQALGDLVAAGERLPPELRDHGLPVAFRPALTLTSFDLDPRLGFLPYEDQVRTYVQRSWPFTEAYVDERMTERYESASRQIVSQVASGDLVVDPQGYEIWTTSPTDLVELLEFQADVFHGEMAPWALGLGTMAISDALTSWQGLVKPRFFEWLLKADGKIEAANRNKRSLLAARWAWEREYGAEAWAMIGEELVEHAEEMAAFAVVITAAQHIPYVNVAVDIALLGIAIYEAVKSAQMMYQAEQAVRDATTVVDLQRAAAQRALSNRQGGAAVLLELMGGKAGVKSIRSKVKIRPSHPIRPRSRQVFTNEYQDWFNGLDAKTQGRLRMNPELRATYEGAPPHVRRLLTKCAGPCLPANVTPQDIAVIERVVRNKQLDAASPELRDFFHQNRRDIGAGVRKLEAMSEAELAKFRLGIEPRDGRPSRTYDLADLEGELAGGRGPSPYASLPERVKLAEAEFVHSSQPRLERFVGPNGAVYDEVVALPNGHSYRRKRGESTWCRFSGKPHCGISAERLAEDARKRRTYDFWDGTDLRKPEAVDGDAAGTKDGGPGSAEKPGLEESGVRDSKFEGRRGEVPSVDAAGGAGQKALPDITGAADDVVVLGRQADTAVAADWAGYKVLQIDNWSLEINDAFIQTTIRRRQNVYLASPRAGNMVQTAGRYKGQPTVFARELGQLEAAGYKQVGNYMVHPANLNNFTP